MENTTHYKFHKRIDGIDFYAPSTRKNKKYDAYVNNKKYSFGSRFYQHFFDKIGYYSDLDHLDDDRRYNYINRHKNDKLNEYSPGYFSMYYLW